MSWFNNILEPLRNVSNDLENFKNRIGEITRGFGGLPTSRSDLFDQIANPELQPQTPQEVIQLISNSISNQRDPYVTLPVIYSAPIGIFDRRMTGRVTGLQLAEISSTGDNNEYLHLTYWICHGDIQGLDMVDKTSGTTVLPSSPSETGSIYSVTFNESTRYTDFYAYSNYVRVYVNAGDETNTHSPAWHNDSRTYPGIAHVKIIMLYPVPDGSTVHPDDAPTSIPNWQWHVYGKNPSSLTTADTDPNRSRSALYLYDYLTNSVYGRGIDPNSIDANSFLGYYNIAKSKFPNTPDGVDAMMYLDNSNSTGQNVNVMLKEMMASLIFKRGKFYLKPHNNLVYNSKDLTSTKLAQLDQTFDVTYWNVSTGYLLNGLQFNLTPPEKKVNKLLVTSTEHKYYLGTSIVEGESVESYYPIERVAYIEEPDNINYADETITFTIQGDSNSTWIQAALENQNYQTVVSCTLDSNFLNIDVYDKIRFYHKTIPVLHGLMFQVQSVDINPDLTVSISAIEIEQDRNTWIAAQQRLMLGDQYYSDFLKKNIYDLPASTADDFLQFNNQEISTYTLPYSYGYDQDIYDSGKEYGGVESGSAPVGNDVIESVTATVLGRSPLQNQQSIAVRVTVTTPNALASDRNIVVYTMQYDAARDVYVPTYANISITPNRFTTKLNDTTYETVVTVSGGGTVLDPTRIYKWRAEITVPSSNPLEPNGTVLATGETATNTGVPSWSTFSALTNWYLFAPGMWGTALTSRASQLLGGTWQIDTLAGTVTGNLGSNATALLYESPILFETQNLDDLWSETYPVRFYNSSSQLVYSTNTSAATANGSAVYYAPGGGVVNANGSLKKLAREYYFLLDSDYNLDSLQRSLLTQLSRTDLLYADT